MFWQIIVEGFFDLVHAIFAPPAYDTPPETLSMNQPVTSPQSPETAPHQAQQPNPDTLVAWDTPANCRHNVRVLADLEGLTVFQKNMMSQVIHCESGYNIHARHDNGTSVDHGICQWNSFFHKDEITPDEAENNPEKAIRLMCSYVKAGRISQWVCFSKGMYKKYSA